MIVQCLDIIASVSFNVLWSKSPAHEANLFLSIVNFEINNCS